MPKHFIAKILIVEARVNLVNQILVGFINLEVFIKD